MPERHNSPLQLDIAEEVYHAILFQCLNGITLRCNGLAQNACSMVRTYWEFPSQRGIFYPSAPFACRPRSTQLVRTSCSVT